MSHMEKPHLEKMELVMLLAVNVYKSADRAHSLSLWRAFVALSGRHVSDV
jgi:hypothetical protein